eukprot:NODE_8132_length_1520_cov_9.465901.p1 GENE.NODE_8132_length_1520_cov_9.465901~~NODE_8132_length_1520_cov_9.465901.p1  ORF type:complete len:206 (+),score=54.77 NODE_8132_length_1520_cov_9.465901:85-618(+)
MGPLKGLNPALEVKFQKELTSREQRGHHYHSLNRNIAASRSFATPMSTTHKDYPIREIPLREAAASGLPLTHMGYGKGSLGRDATYRPFTLGGESLTDQTNPLMATSHSLVSAGRGALQSRPAGSEQQRPETGRSDCSSQASLSRVPTGSSRSGTGTGRLGSTARAAGPLLARVVEH